MTLSCLRDTLFPAIGQVTNSIQQNNKLLKLKYLNLLLKKFIVPLHYEVGECEFISPIFVFPKKDGTYRMILNLKHLNTFAANQHLKMDTLWSVIKLMIPDCVMASKDLKVAYYSVPVHEPVKNY